MRTVSIDLGGTRCRAAIVDYNGEIIDVIRWETPQAEREPWFLIDIAQEIRRRVGGGYEPLRVVVGVPGIVDYDSGQLVSAPNLPKTWKPRLTEAWLSHHLNLPVSLANDADLAAVGEAYFGAGQGSSEVVYVTISTGVGAGVVIGGKLVQGVRSGAEIGHLVIDRVAAAKGLPATVEELGSGTAIARSAEAAGFTEVGEAFADLVRAGDPRATEIWDEAIFAAGFGVAAMAWMIVPACIVIGGGVGRNSKIVMPALERQLKEFGPVAEEPIRLVTAELCDDAALVGGAAWSSAVRR